MRRFYLVLVLMLTLLPAGSASAHILASSGPISAILHIGPNDDNPVAGQLSTLYFSFGDTGHAFQLNKCTCTLTIKGGGQPFTLPLAEAAAGRPSIYTANVPYFFPAAGLYDVTISGSPSSANTFRPFNLGWHITVGQTPNPPISSSWRLTVGYLLFIAGIFSLLGLVFYKML